MVKRLIFKGGWLFHNTFDLFLQYIITLNVTPDEFSCLEGGPAAVDVGQLATQSLRLTWQMRNATLIGQGGRLVPKAKHLSRTTSRSSFRKPPFCVYLPPPLCENLKNELRSILYASLMTIQWPVFGRIHSLSQTSAMFNGTRFIVQSILIVTYVNRNRSLK